MSRVWSPLWFLELQQLSQPLPDLFEITDASRTMPAKKESSASAGTRRSTRIVDAAVAAAAPKGPRKAAIAAKKAVAPSTAPKAKAPVKKAPVAKEKKVAPAPKKKAAPKKPVASKKRSKEEADAEEDGDEAEAEAPVSKKVRDPTLSTRLDLFLTHHGLCSQAKKAEKVRWGMSHPTSLDATHLNPPRFDFFDLG